MKITLDQFADDHSSFSESFAEALQVISLHIDNHHCAGFSDRVDQIIDLEILLSDISNAHNILLALTPRGIELNLHIAG